MSDDWSDIKQDPTNANLGTEVGAQALERSLERNKAGRGIVLADDGSIIGGNKTALEAARQGLKLKIVDTDGDTLIANRRTDIPTSSSPAGQQLAIEDNRVAELNLNFDMDEIARAAHAGVDLDGLWDDATIDAITADFAAVAADPLLNDNAFEDPIGDVKDDDDAPPRAVREGKTRDERTYRFEFSVTFDDSLLIEQALSESELRDMSRPEWLSYMAGIFLMGKDQGILDEYEARQSE